MKRSALVFLLIENASRYSSSRRRCLFLWRRCWSRLLRWGFVRCLGALGSGSVDGLSLRITTISVWIYERATLKRTSAFRFLDAAGWAGPSLAGA